MRTREESIVCIARCVVFVVAELSLLYFRRNRTGASHDVLAASMSPVGYHNILHNAAFATTALIVIVTVHHPHHHQLVYSEPHAPYPSCMQR